MLQGRFVNLRFLTMEDIPLIIRWFLENELSMYYLGTGLASSEEIRQYFENALKNPARRRDFVIIKKDDSAPIGLFSLENISWIHRNASAVILLGTRGERKKVYAWEAHVLCFDFAFQALNLHRVDMKFFSENKPILKIKREWDEYFHRDGLESIYTFEGRLREAAFILGKYTDIEVYGILRDHYMGVRKKISGILRELQHNEKVKKHIQQDIRSSGK